MIAVDTNVLLRYLLQDDERQSSKAAALINGHTDVLVTHVVLAETLWTLCGRKYKASYSDVVATLHALFEEPRIVFEHAPTVWQALELYRQSVEEQNQSVDFPDALIVSCANTAASRFSDKLVAFFTFDQAAQSLPGAEAP